MDGQSTWTVWGLDAGLTVTDQSMLPEAERIVQRIVADVDLACSRFRRDSELMMLQPDMAAGVTVSDTLRFLIECALTAAQLTDGDVDPTLGADLDALGCPRGITSMPLTAGSADPPSPPRNSLPGEHLPVEPAPAARRVPGWQRITLEGHKLTAPADLRLDLGATAKAVAADRAAAEVFARLGCGALVCLGGDLATAGPGPAASGNSGAWQILVQDLPADPDQHIALEPGFALATSSTQKRRWKHAGTDVHHILDPRFGLPAPAVWRSVTVAAPTCLEANAFSTAGVVRGTAAPAWFTSEGVPARLVDRQGRVVAVGGWPAERYVMGAGVSHG